jgi:hypothetical protein
MIRSILWISISAPASPFSSGCVALPQPRSRMALAAETRAAGVASFRTHDSDQPTDRRAGGFAPASEFRCGILTWPW